MPLTEKEKINNYNGYVYYATKDGYKIEGSFLCLISKKACQNVIDTIIRSKLK